jgi:hypothetical protein
MISGVPLLWGDAAAPQITSLWTAGSRARRMLPASRDGPSPAPAGGASARGLRSDRRIRAVGVPDARGPGSGPPSVVVPGSRHGMRRSGVRLRRAQAFSVARRVYGLPVVSVPMALVDLAAERAGMDVQDVVQEALRAGRCSEAELRAELGRGRSGAAAMRRILDVVGDGADSRWERQLRRLCRAGGLPAPSQPALISRGERRILPDLYWPGLVVEVDGWSAHSSSRAFQQDRRRQKEIILRLGLRILRYTPRHPRPAGGRGRRDPAGASRCGLTDDHSRCRVVGHRRSDFDQRGGALGGGGVLAGSESGAADSAGLGGAW